MADDPDDSGPPVELSDEETAVMLGTFAGASFFELSSSTGLSHGRLEAIVTRLTHLGLIEPQLIPLEPEAPVEPHTDPPSADDCLVALLDGALDGLAPAEPPLPPDAPPHALPNRARQQADPNRARQQADPSRDREGADPPAAPDDAVVELPVEEPRAEPVEEPRAEPVEEPRAEPVEETREYRKLFETELHPLPHDERVALAGTATGARLFALCFDPDAQVVRALLENAAATVEHARLVAFHHRTSRGLDELVRRPALASDPMVQRRLVRNPGLDEGLFRRLMGNKRLLELYRVSLDRDVPDRSRAAARTVFRTRFGTAQAEERVEVIWATEGRVLMAMSGLTFDSRTTSILCSRTYASIMLVQNLARFPATPPPLIAHLLRQPMVKRQAHLKNQLLQHPNTPADAKRRL